MKPCKQFLQLAVVKNTFSFLQNEIGRSVRVKALRVECGVFPMCIAIPNSLRNELKREKR